MIIPTLIIHSIYVPQWSLVELTYFAITTNHLIGLGDLVPCVDLYGQTRSTCAMIITVYVIIQVITASLLTNMWFMFLQQNRQFLSQRRHHSDPLAYTNDSKRITIPIYDEYYSNVFA
ncbi:unnamed protein product [Adineta ricciae]|uniref:Potassium channel domain-containing protein n=1 Tax=Adineta ricciae TaxID=249248 RepID=A0A814ZJ83_ADIRI|nr:unnamed protein product [Adineta ricciae]